MKKKKSKTNRFDTQYESDVGDRFNDDRESNTPMMKFNSINLLKEYEQEDDQTSDSGLGRTRSMVMSDHKGNRVSKRV